MTSPLKKEFDGALHGLFMRRTGKLREQIRKPTPGKRLTYSRSFIDETIATLCDLATQAHVKNGIDRMREIYDEKRYWRNRGWGVEKKRKLFLAWYDLNIKNKNCVYVFWAGDKCRYIGRTENGKSRPKDHFYKSWFPGVTRVDIYHSRAKRNLPELECLATHRFSPSHSKIKPSKKKYRTQCPMCKRHSVIKKEVKAIFRLRKR